MSTVLQGNVFVVGLWSQEVSKVYGKKLLYNLPDKKFLSDNDMYLWTLVLYVRAYSQVTSLNIVSDNKLIYHFYFLQPMV